MTTRAPTQTYANNHIIADVAEPRIGANVPTPFPRNETKACLDTKQ